MFWPDKFIQHCLGLVRFFHNSFNNFFLTGTTAELAETTVLGLKYTAACRTNVSRLRKKTLYRGVRRAHSSCAPNTIQTCEVSSLVTLIDSPGTRPSGVIWETKRYKNLCLACTQRSLQNILQAKNIYKLLCFSLVQSVLNVA